MSVWDITKPQNNLVPDVYDLYIGDKNLFNAFFFFEHNDDGSHDYRMARLPILKETNTPDIGTNSQISTPPGDIYYSNTDNNFWLNNTSYRIPIRKIVAKVSNTDLPVAGFTYTFTARANHRYWAFFRLTIAIEHDYLVYSFNPSPLVILKKNGTEIGRATIAVGAKNVASGIPKTIFPSGSDIPGISTSVIMDGILPTDDTTITYTTGDLYNVTGFGSGLTKVLIDFLLLEF
ncbi:MAG: hypothetical protein ACP5JP_02305 [bacterium]